jgi:DNA-binding NarL/FixJ family response regulator
MLRQLGDEAIAGFRVLRLRADVSRAQIIGRAVNLLTAREQEVLGQLASGQANKEIADTLGISEHTTKGHLKSILGKLRVADRTQAVIAAVQRGLIHY